MGRALCVVEAYAPSALWTADALAVQRFRCSRFIKPSACLCADRTCGSMWERAAVRSPLGVRGVQRGADLWVTVAYLHDSQCPGRP